MSEGVRNAVASGSAARAGVSTARRIGLVGLAVLLPVATLLVIQQTTGGADMPLFAALGPEESILVPADRAGQVRSRVARAGLPIADGEGFEVFDRTNLGARDFTQRLDDRRALQEDLARTISQLRGVGHARVHLVLPEPARLAEGGTPASASIFLEPVAGARLSAEQLRGVAHLVASSVEGLVPERVTVIDTAGRVLLAGGGASSGIGAMSPRRREAKSGVEEGLERRVQTLLDSVLGPGQAVTRVSAQVNFDRLERTEERFDPNPVMRQETRTVESGSPAPLAGTTSSGGRRQSESRSYELSRVVARRLTSPGEVQRLSVAVLLDVPGQGGPRREGQSRRGPVPRPAEEIDKIRKAVMSAVGYSAARGDEVTVVEMPFERPARQRPVIQRERGDGSDASSIGGLARASRTSVVAAMVLLAGGLAGVVLMRRRARARELAAVTRSLEDAAGDTPAGDQAAAPVGGGAAKEAGVAGEFMGPGREQEGLRQRAVALASAEPEATARLLRAWMASERT